MRVLYDAQAFDIQKYGGVSKVFNEICRGVKKKAEIILPSVGTSNEYLKSEGYESTDDVVKRLKAIGQLDANITPSQINWHALNLQQALNEIKGRNFDVFHATHYSPYFLNEIGDKPYVVTIHDMTDIVYKDYRLWDEDGWENELDNRKKICSKAAKVVCISEQTKKDVMKYLNVEEDRIEVIYNAYDPVDKNFQYNKVCDFPYLLYVGTRQGIYNYKCFIPFICQAAEFLHKHPEFKIICTGGGAFSRMEKDLFQQLGIENRVIQTYVDENTLNNLYHFAFCYVFPSCYEGFGLPVLEAWKNDCITLLNYGNPVFREVADAESSLWFSFKEGTEVAPTLYDSLERLYNGTEEEKEKIKENARENLKKYSWEKVCEDYLKVYEEVSK